MDGLGAKVLIIFLLQLGLCTAFPVPLNCSDPNRLCSSFLAFKPTSEQTLPVIESMFDVLSKDITIEGNGRDYVFIRKNCSCAPTIKVYLSNTTYTVRENNGSVYDMVTEAYHGLAYFSSNFTREAKKGGVVSLRLMCGCSSALWNYLMSYVLRDGDSVESLASRFGVSMDSIVTANGLDNPDNVTVGQLYFIPLNSVPGEPYPVQNDIAPAPVPESSDGDIAATQVKHKSHVPMWWIIGSLAVGLLLIIILVVVFISLRSSSCCRGALGDGKHPHKFHILRNASFCCGSGRDACRKSEDWKQPTGETSNRHANIPTVISTDVFDMEKPVVFTYEEVLSCTDGFSDSYLLGHGRYGSVYYGNLREQEVAIKRMTATKTKEFMAEMKVLCKVHHTNLVELIGYAASGDELFLIYEHAQKGSLKSHLHDPQHKGHTPLSWNMRVQIAVDAARGLEYIHEHTKPHYVHRDIKTSNILLDGAYRAKISDFGLAKLVEKTNDGEALATTVVGTFGYLAPEYLRDGLATNKSDIYAFGIVLFEMISGKEAITRTQGSAGKSADRRSLASVMLAALRNSPDSMSMSSLAEYVDPNLMELYPQDCLFKMALLAKQCVDDDPVLRPDMKQIVISLSHIQLSSIEWEATLSGNSQVFSGLVQGR
ncbi:OLC1v1014882C1 [Oldenlandia corymbosa var. corymbosa]|uniref:OLC1v1014882C1 n=1 Tax=Oldenlandia corymbosa var. corymbosa TaxID=529605 RepID=A0AAV1E1Y5_OLDCO|nr:OLC1v1014882C1 [Oldenlandia corymbosa var. corymbosa]